MKRVRIFAVLCLVILLFSGCDLFRESYYKISDRRTYTIHPSKHTISFAGAEYKYRIIGDWEDFTILIYYPDGNVYTEYGRDGKKLESTYRRQYQSVVGWVFSIYSGMTVFTSPVDTFDIPGAELAALVYDEIPEDDKNPLVIPGLALILLGVANIFWPKVFWFFRYGRNVRDMELSDLALNFHTYGGLAAIVIGIVLLFV